MVRRKADLSDWPDLPVIRVRPARESGKHTALSRAATEESWADGGEGKGKGFWAGARGFGPPGKFALILFFLFFSSYFLLNLKFKFKFNFDKPKCTSHKILA